VIPFAFFEVGFISRIIRVGFAFDLNVSFNGYAIGEQQPQFMLLPFFVTCLPEEDPVWRIPYCVPRVLGGSRSVENRVLLHPECHDMVHDQRIAVSKPRPLPGGVRRP
jgi:hypothetical protein